MEKLQPEQEFKLGQEFKRGRSLKSFGPEESAEAFEEVKRLAQFGDVTYQLSNFFWDRFKDKENDPELLEVQRQGYISESIIWIKAMTPEGMKTGTASTEVRLEKAKEFAKLAGITVEKIATEHGLQLPKSK